MPDCLTLLSTANFKNGCSKSVGFGKSKKRKIHWICDVPVAGRPCSATSMKLVTVLTVQQAMQLLLHSAYGSRALRSKTAADRCVNLAIHKSGKHGRIHTQPVLQVTLGLRCSVQKTTLLKSLIAVFWTLFCPCLCESDTLGECGAIDLVSSISSNNQQP